MQSSMIMALRTLVMLLSLLAIPLAAVVGTGSWPHVRELLDGLRTDLLARLNSSPAAAADAPVAPLIVQPLALPLPPAPAAPITTVPAAANNQLTSPLTSPPPLPKPPFWPGVGTSPSNSSVPPPAAPVSAPHVDPQTTPAAYAAPQNAAPPSSAQAPPDVLGWIQHRLKTLGAAYYRLETAGSQGEMFRFQCKMTSPTNPNYVRYFEATATEPQRAMQHVLDQVDAWMASRDTPR